MCWCFLKVGTIFCLLCWLLYLQQRRPITLNCYMLWSCANGGWSRTGLGHCLFSWFSFMFFIFHFSSLSGLKRVQEPRNGNKKEEQLLFDETTLKSTVNLHHILKHAATPCPRPLSSVALDCLCHTPDDRKSVDFDDQHTQKNLYFGNSFPISSQSRFCEETNR